jgi:hypothetical protein
MSSCNFVLFKLTIQGFIDFIVRPLYEAWGEFMKEDLEVHLKNINENKTFWKSCSDDPQIMKEIDLAKTEKWIPLEEATSDLELLLKQEKVQNSYPGIQKLDELAADTASQALLPSIDKHSTDGNTQSGNQEITPAGMDVVISIEANENQTSSESENGL